MLQGRGKETGGGESRRRMKGAEVGNKKMNGWGIKTVTNTYNISVRKIQG